LEVFNHLPRANFKDISLTYRIFHRLSRPLLFADFDFHPYLVGASGALLLPTAEVEE
ncbi:hypothetical protein FB451DRAFT_959543, partial [Mycena latifolia]